MEYYSIPKSVVSSSQTPNEYTKWDKPYQGKEIEVDRRKAEACNHHNQPLIKKSIKIIIKNTSKGKFFKKGRYQGYRVKHQEYGEPVNSVPIV